MNITDDFDIDNIDIEQQMMLCDIEEEQAEQEEVEEEEIVKKALSARKILNAKNLILDLERPHEIDRTIYKFYNNNKLYTGFVIYKMNATNFIFSVEDKDSSNGRKSMKFCIDDIKQEKD